MSLRMVPYAEKEVHTEDGKVLDLRYFVLVDASKYPIRYGAKIIEANSGDQAAYSDITTKNRTIYDLVERLVQDTVTPVSLSDVITDWL